MGFSGGLEKLKDLGKTCCGSIAVLIGLAICLAIPVSMIVMGVVYKDDCPAEDLITKYLISMGVLLVVRNLYSLISRIVCGRDSDGDVDKKSTALCGIYDCAVLGWFIAGCVFIYRLHGDFQSHDSKADDFCNYTIYWYAFWITTSSYILLGAALVLVCCALCVAAICS